jgi:hypothetical protein
MRLGDEVLLLDPASVEQLPAGLDMALVWNGVKGRTGRIHDRLRQKGVATWILERGFFDRMRHVQIDPDGFGHRASWASELADCPPPRCGRDRFFKAWGSRPAPQRARDGGVVLLLCQVDGDAQLRDCPIRHAPTLVAAVSEACPPGLELAVRPHPLFPFDHPRVLGGSLAQAVRQARFCVTLNSNAANEAIAWGCPVLTLGPCLAARAGASLAGSLPTLRDDLLDMRDGWCPADEQAHRLLYHLAARQYDNAELAEGGVLRDLLNQGRPHGPSPAFQSV